MAQIEFNATSFNQFLNEGKLMGTKCKKCGAVYLPPRPLCINCGSSDVEWIQLKGSGKLATFTAISVGPTMMASEGFDRFNPYCSGIIQLEEGPKISARIIGFDNKNPTSIKVGTEMVVEFQERCVGDIKKTYLAFKPATPVC